MNNEKLKNKLFEALDEGLLTWEEVTIACIKYMSIDDVADMIRRNEFIEEDEDDDEDVIDRDEIYIYEFPEELTEKDIYIAVRDFELILIERTKSIINKNGDGVFIKGSFNNLLKFAKEYLGLKLNMNFLCQANDFDYEISNNKEEK